MLKDLDVCNSCGAVITAATRTIHWDFHGALLTRLSELDARVQELKGQVEVLERLAATDAELAREVLERAPQDQG